MSEAAEVLAEGHGHQVVRTRGGGVAVRSLAAGEVMHPGVGARAEAEALYVRQSRLAGRLAAGGPPLVLFDVGLGAAANAAAAWELSEAAPAGAARLEIVSFERDLGALRLALEHGGLLGLEGAVARAARVLLSAGGHETPRTTWRVVEGDLTQALVAGRAAGVALRPDVVFWDPFSPRANPEAWTVAAFAALRRLAGARCTLFTYSASTAVRVALLLAGWRVGVGDATGSKAHTTAAAVDERDLTRPLDARWLSRLRHPGVPLPADAPPDAVVQVTRLEQFVAQPAR